MGLSVSKDRQIKDDWYLETFAEQVRQELIAPVFKCQRFMQSTEAEPSNEMVCVLSFAKCQIVYETDRRVCQELCLGKKKIGHINPLYHFLCRARVPGPDARNCVQD